MLTSDPDRPRERIRSRGPRGLTVAELLAAVIGTGTSSMSAQEVGRVLWDRADGSMRRLVALDVSELEAISGVGRATSARIVAALELGRRAAAEPDSASDHIRGPSDVFRRMGPRLRDLSQEECHALLLDTRHRVVREVLVTRGILDASLVHPREVFRAAVAEGASGLVLVHNHPSGDPRPSEEDRAVTRQLVETGRMLGIPVLDHVVVGRGRWASAMNAES